MANDDDDRSSLDTEPFRWAVIPIVIAFFGIAILYYFIHRRRARRQGRDPHLWPRADGTARRWAPWTGTRSQEGLNELGEAPPPYVTKGDEEEGGERPPEYPAVPPPAVTTESRRG